MLSGSSILITGGTGSFGHTFVPMTLQKYNPRRLVIFSRDEMKHWEMAKDYIAFLTMAELELSYLRSDPALMFRGTHYDTFGIPCVVRPEVIYCCLGKN